MSVQKIQVRSPWLVSVTGLTGEEAKVELYLWNDPDSIPAQATHTLSQDIIDTDIYFDISPYCREYISFLDYSEISAGYQTATVSEYAFCTVKTYRKGTLQNTTEYIAFDGYAYHEDGYNSVTSVVMCDEGEYYVRPDENSGGIFVYNNGVGTWTANYTGLTSGGTSSTNITGTIGYVPLLLNTYASEGNTLEIKFNGSTQKTFTATTECEAKYTPVECDFVNRYGVWQRVVFFKAKKETIDIRNTEYKMYPSSVNYNSVNNIVQTFNTNGTTKITCNTGWVREGYSEIMQQLLLSEKVVLDGVAVNVVTKSLEKFTHLNNNNINYQIEFIESHDIINYVI